MLRLDRTLRPLLVAAAVLVLSPLTLATELRVEVGGLRSMSPIRDLTDEAVRRFARQTALLGRRQLEAWSLTGRLKTEHTLPLRVVLTQNGVPIRPPFTVFAAGGGDISLVFHTSPHPRAFPAVYQTLLQDTLTLARPAMNAVFGSPAVGGNVTVSNYDADIQDRYAVAGGYFIPNALGGPEIRFPVYNSTVAASINFVHCLLLAYQNPEPYVFEAFNEGLVRAATMRVARTPGSLPSAPTQSEIEATLDSLYDASAFYDWSNQSALGCETFIAPNLLNTQLPPGGSTGGIYLLRYLMAGTAFAKVIAEHPAFIAVFNGLYYADPGAFTTMPALVVLGQTALDTVAGGTGTIEGMSFADWVERQYILDTETTAGLKVMLNAFPIDATGGTSDFGVFGIEANVFRTDLDGNESLLVGTAYPIYWRPDFSRFFMTAQDDRMSITGAYGSVAPNFPAATFGNQVYRVAVDVPFGGMNSRVVLPAGAYSTGSSPLPKNFIGTLTGFAPPSSGEYSVTVEWTFGGGGSQATIPVRNFAFGFNITNANFVPAQAITVRLFEDTGGGPVEVHSRRVNKGLGMLAINLSHPDSDATWNDTLQPRLEMRGVPLQPYRTRPTGVFGIAEGDLLFAHWNPTTVSYDLFPDISQTMAGVGFFVRPSVATPYSVNGYAPPRTPVSVSLLPGWNMVSVPFNDTLATSNVSFTVATEAVTTYAQSLGATIGTTVFEFQPDGLNPDEGTMFPATTFVPGMAYYVRALRPDGAVMIFTPTVFSFVGGSQPLSPGTPLRVHGDNMWESKLLIENSRSKTTYAVVGQSRHTFRGFDPRIDSELPPTVGGLQVAVMTERAMFKDVNVLGDTETFRVLVKGLVPGERCVLKWSPLVGRKSVTLYDVETRRTKRLSEDGSFVFNAAGSTHRFEVRVGGR
ncbi:MAG: hypothetical protein WD716_06650 [Fimbriimonadaceae bacterium]